MSLNLFNRKIGGVIAYLGIEDFYNTLSKDDRNKIRQVLTHPYQLNTNYVEKDLDSGNATYAGGKRSFFYTMGCGVTSSNLKERLLLESLKYSNDAWDIHFSRQTLAEFYYKEKRFKECEEYCLSDISSVNDFINTIDYLKGAMILTFKRLAILYEKQGRFNEAIEVSKQALEIGQTDGTKNGYEGRIERLIKKL